MAPGATSNPTNAVFTGTRFTISSPQKAALPANEENASYYHGKKTALIMNRMHSEKADLQVDYIPAEARF
jgi:hypothetical protein